MATLNIKSMPTQNGSKRYTIVKKAFEDEPVSDLKKRQLAHFKQGLKEAILISRGEMDAPSFSTLWDE